MAHEIYIDEGRASMMYTGEVPWHKLGTRLDRPATAAEAIEAANLDWEVAKLPLFATNGAHGVRIEGKYATMRADKIGKPDCKTFGIVSEGYTPLQNRDAFGFFDTLVRDDKAAIYHTAGALGNGERIWILAKLPDDIIVAGSDITQKYLLLSNNHDGKAGVQIKFTPIRVVCNNTLTLALSLDKNISVPHNVNLEERLVRVRQMLGTVNMGYAWIAQRFKELAKVPMDLDRLAEYLNAVFPYPPEPAKPKILDKLRTMRSRSAYFFDEGLGNREKGVAGTLWAAYNGITEMVDHSLATGSPFVSADARRLQNIWFGNGASVKARAFNVAVGKLKGLA